MTAVSLAAALSACAPHRVPANIGVMPSPAGTARILFVHCEDAGVTAVSLSRFDMGAGAGRALWRIRASVPSAAALFTIGVAPFGFETALPLARSLPPLRPLQAEVRTTAGPYTVGFRALDLVPGRVMRASADLVSRQEFTGGCVRVAGTSPSRTSLTSGAERGPRAGRP